MTGHGEGDGRLRGRRLLTNRYRNKGTAFTREERDRLGLRGLLPPAVESLDAQLVRVRLEYESKPTDLDKHIYLRLLQQRQSVLFYRFLIDHLADTLPIVYTPTVGLACQQWSRIYRREQGLYVSLDDLGQVGTLLDNVLVDMDSVRAVVVTDGERILGLGDLGVGGMGIPIGKLALYSAVGGIDPATTLPIVLDVGTDNETLLSDPLYLGLRRRRSRGPEYDQLVDELVDALQDRCPGVVLQWEDFAQPNALRLLARHRDRICSFNDDIQGTAAVTAAAIAAGMGIAEVPLAELRTVIVGAGSAGVGIANQLVAILVREGLGIDAARRQVWLVDRDGLLCDGMEVREFQRPFCRGDSESLPLLDVVRAVHPHALVGVTGQPGLFTEDVVRSMAAEVARPIVLPLSNPTPRAEAIPSDVIGWSNGTALVGTGSPFAPVTHAGAVHRIPQVNNVYVFPGLVLAAIAAGAERITDAMVTEAALAVAADAAESGSLMPPVERSQDITVDVALAVARQAVADGVAPAASDAELASAIARTRWTPSY